MKNKPEVSADYNGYDYEEYWREHDRAYEDAADRMAIRKLLPKKMQNFVDIGGGYGRLADEYLDRSEKVTIFDYSKTELKQAKDKYGDRISTKSGSIYELPFEDNTFDGMMMVRVSHHLEDLEAALKELYRVLAKNGTFVIEIANKKTLPKMFRYWFKKSDVNPFSYEPSLQSYNKMINFHPKYAEDLFKKVSFDVAEVLSVSNYRSSTLKKIFGTKFLIGLENKTQKPLAKVRFAPSIYYRLIKK